MKLPITTSNFCYRYFDHYSKDLGTVCTICSEIRISDPYYR